MEPDISAPRTHDWQVHWGRLLRTARQVAGLSLSELSATTGLSKGYLSKLESGH
ncbi:MAG: helix-turn-helix domain-containing protein, partial [Ktedonobacterales bacterium]